MAATGPQRRIRYMRRAGILCAAWRHLEAAFDADDSLDLKSVWILKEARRNLYGSTSGTQTQAGLDASHRWAGVYDVEGTNRLSRPRRQWEQRSWPTPTPG